MTCRWSGLLGSVRLRSGGRGLRGHIEEAAVQEGRTPRRTRAEPPSLEVELQRAVERQEFTLEYQPIVELKSGAVVGAEALVRWRHPCAAPSRRGEFLPLAEQTGQISAIGAFVLERAARQARSWQLASPAGANFVLSVNLSARQAADPSTLDLVRSSLETGDLSGESVVLEISAGDGVVEDRTIATLNALRKLGVRIALDDFGAGMSFREARRLPLDIVKLDRAFVVDVAARPADASFAEALLTVGRARGLQTVAKGVETTDQARRLLALGCDMGQGYLYSKPLGAEGIGAVLARGRLGTMARR
jgi:EAL domain-containing protein (putative c-di-GMP-specific phosphodiesterase class I)